MTPINQNSTYERAVLVSLNLSAWDARKYDKQVSEEIAIAHNATADVGRYNKRLMPKGDKGNKTSYELLKSHIAAMRQEHYAQTLAWSDDGWRILPIKNYHNYTDKMRDGKHAFESLLSDFILDYPTLRQRIQASSTIPISDKDFPKDIRSRFGWDNHFKPVPTANDFRVELSQEEIDILASDLTKRNETAFREAHEDAVKRLFDTVQKIQITLSSPDTIFRDSLIQNARDLCDVLTRLNISNDPKLEKMRHETELLALTEPQVLRDVADVRKDTANRAQTILDAMSNTFGKELFA